MQTLKSHYLLMEIARSQIQYFSDLGTEGFHFLGSFFFFSSGVSVSIVIQTRQTSPQKEIIK